MECISVGVPVRSSVKSVPHPTGMEGPVRDLKPRTLERAEFVESENPAAPASPPEAAAAPFRDPPSIVTLNSKPAISAEELYSTEPSANMERLISGRSHPEGPPPHALQVTAHASEMRVPAISASQLKPNVFTIVSQLLPAIPAESIHSADRKLSIEINAVVVINLNIIVIFF